MDFQPDPSIQPRLAEKASLQGTAKEMLSSKAIGVFFKEYDKIQPGVVKRVNDLFRLVIDEINKNEKLVKELVELEDKEIQKAEESFKKYLKDEARDIKAIRKNIGR